MAKNKFMRGTLILLGTSIVLKMLGFLYQIAIIRLVGTEPVGVLNMAYPFYIAFVVIATAGIPLALSKIIAEQLILNHHRAITKVMRLSFGIVFILGGFFFLVGIVVMPSFFDALGSDHRLRWCFYVLLPGIVIVPFASIIRGYFQGIQQMIYPSLAQIAEQIVRLLAGMTLVLWLKPLGVMYVAMGLAGGMIIGEVAGLALILFFYWRVRRRNHLIKPTPETPSPTIGLIKSMAYLGVPTTLTKLTSSVDMMIEASLIPYCFLQVGYNYSQAASIYGQFCGVALSLLTVPMVLTSALSTALVPAIAESAAKGHKNDMANKCSQSLRMTYIFSLPVIVMLFLRANALGMVLFKIDGIGTVVCILALGAIFLYLGQTSVGILQGLGLTKMVFGINFIGSVIKLVCIYYFILHGKMGINGVALAFTLAYSSQCLLNLLVLGRRIPIHLTLKQIVLPLFFAGIMIGCLNFFDLWLGKFLNPGLTTLTGIMLSGLCYLCCLLLSKQFSLKDLFTL